MSKRIMRKATVAGAVAAGAVLAFGSSAAYADSMTSVNNYGSGTGNQSSTPVQVPVDVCGNSAAGIGMASAYCDGGTSASLDSKAIGSMTSADNNGFANGNQVQAPTQAPITACGNAVAALGAADAGCTGGADAYIGKASHEGAVTESAVTEGGSGDMTAVGNYMSTTGNQVKSGWQSPLDTSGNAASHLGYASAGSDGGVSAKMGKSPSMTATDNNGFANANQVYAPIQTPVSFCGNSATAIGAADAGCTGGADAKISG
ncbi:MAG: chaplin family protein [Stackebrandtia sp.]